MNSHFDLNAAFERWRNELAAQPQLSAEVRRELERHLADSITELCQRGLIEEEAFWLARRRIGQPQQLSEEFAKADPLKVWRQRAFWMAASVLAFLMWMELASSLLRLLSSYLHPNFRFYSVSAFFNASVLIEVIVFCLPFALAITLVATGRMGWVVRMSAIVFHSQVRLAITAVLLVALSSYLGAIATGHFLSVLWYGIPQMSESLFDLTTQNMVMPLIFVPLLCLFMPKKAKTPRRT